MKQILSTGSSIFKENSLVFVGGYSSVDFGGPGLIDHKKLPPPKQITVRSIDAMNDIMGQTNSKSVYILSGICTDISGNPSSVSSANIFHISQKLTDSLISDLPSTLIITGSEIIQEVSNTQKDINAFIETLAVSEIPDTIAVLTDRRLTPEEIDVIKKTGVVKHYVRIMETHFDGEPVGYNLITADEYDIAKK